MRKLIPLLGLMTVLTIAGCAGKKPGTRFTTPEQERQIDALLSTMTLEEKVGQMTIFTGEENVTFPISRSEFREGIRTGRIGAVFNVLGVKNTRELQQLAVDGTRLKIPLIFGYDVIHGYKTIFPLPIAEACSWDLAAIEKSARIAATEATAEGLHWTFAPMVDIARDPRWGRICEGAGEDQYLGSRIAEARVKGFQGDDLSAPDTLMSCAKHFAAYGAAQAGREYHTVDLSERTLRDVYLEPFHAAQKAGAGSFMTSFNEIAGVPSSGNSWLLTDVLRKEWGFEGFVANDYTAINEMVAHGFAADEKQAGELALKAGVDMDMQGGVFYKYLKALIDEGKVAERTVDEAVRRVLRMKFALGLFDDPYRYCSEAREQELVLSKGNLDFAVDIAKKSIVLLKNDGALLPLDKKTRTLAVIGPLADNRRELIGSWSAAGDGNQAVSLLEGIRKKVDPTTRIIYAKGCEIEGGTREAFGEAKAAASRADAVIVAVGEGAWMSGEAASRSQITLPGYQTELLQELIQTGKPIAAVLMNGRPLDLSWLHAHVPAILETWFLGTRAGDAISEVLFGDYSPSGKLVVSFPRSLGQVPIYYSMKNTGRPMSGEKNTSKYLDIPNDPLYPFGFGLGYTTFIYSDISLDKTEISPNDSVKAWVEVTNTGGRKGEDVVQMYVRDLVGSVTRPVKELKGFEKISLEPGESRRVEFTIRPEDLRFHDINMKYSTEPGDFRVYIGPNSRDVKEVSFRIRL